jgi:aryl-alcohol dehydrogenase-like predicted oxidoreductase
LSIRANQDKLEAAIALADLAVSADLSLIHLALGFVLSNPGVTSAIIGPRTMDHLISQVDGWEVTLDDDLLDKIDEIIPPGTNVNQIDSGWDPPTLSDPSLRRRNYSSVRQGPRRV